MKNKNIENINIIEKRIALFTQLDNAPCKCVMDALQDLLIEIVNKGVTLPMMSATSYGSIVLNFKEDDRNHIRKMQVEINDLYCLITYDENKTIVNKRLDIRQVEHYLYLK